MVIIYDKIVFLHFYLTGDDNGESEIQRITSTLKITGQEVATEFVKIYESTEHNNRAIFARFNTNDISDVDDDDKESSIMELFIKEINNKVAKDEVQSSDLKNMLVGICLIKDFTDSLEDFENRYNRKDKLINNETFRAEINDRIKQLKKDK